MEKLACQLKNQHPALGQMRKHWRLSISGAMRMFSGHWGALSTMDTFMRTFQGECANSATWKPLSSAAGKSNHWETTFVSATTKKSEIGLFVCWDFYVIHYDGNVHINVFTPSRCGRRVDYRFYNHLEQILGQEAVSIDEYDERDGKADQDPGRVTFIHLVHILY